MKETQLMPVEDVQLFAHLLIEECKQHLQTEGHLARLCYIFTSSDQVPESTPFTSVNRLQELERPRTDKEICTGFVMLDLNMHIHNLVNMMATIRPEVGSRVQCIRMAAKMFDQEPNRVDALILQKLKERTGMNDGDIVGSYMEHMIKGMNAYAYIHQAEQWIVSGERAKYAKDLSHEPQRRECFAINWESFDKGEYISVGFEREGGKLDEGKIVKWLEPVVMPSEQASGRLVNILRQERTN